MRIDCPPCRGPGPQGRPMSTQMIGELGRGHLDRALRAGPEGRDDRFTCQGSSPAWAICSRHVPGSAAKATAFSTAWPRSRSAPSSLAAGLGVTITSAARCECCGRGGFQGLQTAAAVHPIPSLQHLRRREFEPGCRSGNCQAIRAPHAPVRTIASWTRRPTALRRASQVRIAAIDDLGGRQVAIVAR